MTPVTTVRFSTDLLSRLQQPNQNDNMPEKVCLSCISEINRCYVFKIKCESSNKTLRQLLPDAAKEALQTVSQLEAAVQTEKSLISIHVQTQKIVTSTQEVQTDFYFSPELYDEKESNFVPFEKVTNAVNKSICSPSQLVIQDEKKICIRNNDIHNMSLAEDEQTETEETYIVVETINNESDSSEEHKMIIQNTGKI